MGTKKDEELTDDEKAAFLECLGYMEGEQVLDDRGRSAFVKLALLAGIPRDRVLSAIGRPEAEPAPRVCAECHGYGLRLEPTGEDCPSCFGLGVAS